MHRLVVTLGPSSFDCPAALVHAGASELRLNASHMSLAEILAQCERIRHELPEVRCIVDLQGKKMRVGPIAPRYLGVGAHVTLTSEGSDAANVFVPHPELFEQVAVGEHLSLDDGRIAIQVIAAAATHLVARVERAGLLQPRKGLNRVEHPIVLSDLPAVDQAIISACASAENVDFAVSFAEDGTEADWVRRRAPNRRVILKLERAEALRNLNELVESADELWLCRGDLGAQLGLSQMARAVARVEPHRFDKPFLLAGQVLEHLSHHDTPTRSEICHVHDMIARGYAGFVLSDETAVGDAPELATRWAARLMRDFEP